MKLCNTCIHKDICKYEYHVNLIEEVLDKSLHPKLVGLIAPGDPISVKISCEKYIKDD